MQTAAGGWFAVLHGVRTRGESAVHVLGRETFLAPVRWTDGWPSIGQEGRVAEVMHAALPPPHPWPAPAVRDDFDSTELAFEWNVLRNPPEGAWSLEVRPGWLRLRGNSASLDDLAATAFVGRRQLQAVFRASTRVVFDPHRRSDEAGLTVRANEKHHIEIALTREGRQRFATLRLRNGEVLRVLTKHKIPVQGGVTLHVSSDGERYFFAVGGKGGQHSLGDISVALLSGEVSGSLSGVYIGLYASGNGVASAVPADFAWFQYEPM